MRWSQAAGIYYNLLKKDSGMNCEYCELVLTRTIHIMGRLVYPAVTQDRLNP